MKKAIFPFILALGLFVEVVLAIALVKGFKVQKAMNGGGFMPMPSAVTSIVTKEETWHPTLNAVGTLEPVNGVQISSDLSGIVTQIGFESGKQVKTGDLLIQLDTTQESAALRSAEARLQLAVVNLKRISDLLQKSSSSRSEYDTSDAEARQAKAAVDEQKALIARKTIRAPFDGLAGIRNVNVGQFVNPGDSLVELTSLDPIYVNFSLPQQNVPVLTADREVSVRVEGLSTDVFPGKINALNSVVDDQTRNITVQATIRNTEHKLRPGMFATVQVVLDQEEKVISLPASSISYAPYGDSVFVVSEGKDTMTGKDAKIVKQQIVTLGASRGDQVAITSGLQPGQEVITSGVFKLRPGASVMIDNSITPGNDPNPTPSDS